MFNELPKDPLLLLSVVNTKLRDYYKNLDILCEELHVEKTQLLSKLNMVGYKYDEETNRFV